MADVRRGLTASDVLSNRQAHGANVLTPPPRVPLWKQYLSKFDDPVIRILIIAAAIAIGVGAIDGKMAEGVGILLAILLATFLAFWNELRAAREFDILNTSSDDILVKVLRDGGYKSIAKRDVVVDDLLFVEVGEEVPADGTILEATGLLVNESKLTGEAEAVEKLAAATLLKGTTVVDGNALFTVTAVGDRTEIGQTLRESILDSGDDSPLQRQLAKLSRIIGVVGFGVALIAFVALFVHGLQSNTIHLLKAEWYFLAALTAGLIVGLVNIWLPIVYDAFELSGANVEAPAWLGGKSWLISLVLGSVLFAALVGVCILSGLIPAAPDAWLEHSDARQLLRNFMIAVTIIVVAVPEGLAMSVTLSLAYSMRKMTASNTLVRRMDACETIGAATVICSDKTGTLTMNAMRVIEAYIDSAVITALPVSPSLRLRTIDAFAVNSTAHLARQAGEEAEPIGNPTEGALLLWLQSQEVDYQAVRDAFTIQTQWLFNSDRKYMATLGDCLHVKGAPEVLLEHCPRIATADGSRDFTAEDNVTVAAKLEEYQSRGMRVLALAYRENVPADTDIDELLIDMVWLGLVAIADPIRPEVPQAITDCRNAGVSVKIVTGDNENTAMEIARQIGIPGGTVVTTGPLFAAMPDDEASIIADKLSVLARARPADKLRLVKLLKARGEVVAVTGDGVNDGPALNSADVGLAMGRSGTSVAREASDIILLDDSFPSIVNAIRWGRSLYENIQRFILFQLTINVAALGLAVLGPFLGYELPLTVLQMLWVNLIMDTFAALALATEPPHDGVLQRPPRSPQAFIITKSMARFIFSVGAIFLAILLGLIVYWQNAGMLNDNDAPSRAGTLLFTTFVLLQFWNLFNAKAMGRRGSVLLTLHNNPSFLAIAAAILVGQVLLVQYGGEVFRTVPLSVMDWLALLGITSIVLWIGEAVRLGRSAME
ncbi:hypothetical protein BH11PLA2_BH11PLA2_27740 [soil metagenome]